MAQRDITKKILAGGEIDLPVNNDEFIFIKNTPVDITVIIDHSPLKMSSGDVSEFSGPVESIVLKNDSVFDIVVTVTVGTGRFNRVIVSGELIVSSYVNTLANGVASALSAQNVKTLTIDNLTEVATIRGSTVSDMADQGSADGFLKAPFWFDGHFYVMSDSNIYQMNAAGGAPLSTVAIGGLPGETTAANKTVSAAACTASGTVYFKRGSFLYRCSVDGGATTQVASGFANSYNRNGGFILDGIFYFKDDADVVAYHIASGAVVDRWTHAAIDRHIFYDPIAECIISHASGGNSGEKYSVSGDHLGATTAGVDSAIGSQGGTVSDDTGTLFAESKNTRIGTAWQRSGTYYGQITLQTPGVAVSSKTFYLEEPWESATKSAVQCITGPIAKYIARAVSGDVWPGYLDALTRIIYFDGRQTYDIGTGTQTFQMRGLADYFTVANSSDITVELLPRIN